MAALPPKAAPRARSQVMAGFGMLAAWAGTFLLLWMMCRYAIADQTVCVVVAGLGLVTFAPLLGKLSDPTRGTRRHGR